jgi:hypothetical protein
MSLQEMKHGVEAVAARCPKAGHHRRLIGCDLGSLDRTCLLFGKVGRPKPGDFAARMSVPYQTVLIPLESVVDDAGRQPNSTYRT